MYDFGWELPNATALSTPKKKIIEKQKQQQQQEEKAISADFQSMIKVFEVFKSSESWVCWRDTQRSKEKESWVIGFFLALSSLFMCVFIHSFQKEKNRLALTQSFCLVKSVCRGVVYLLFWKSRLIDYLFMDINLRYCILYDNTHTQLAGSQPHRLINYNL